jgi:hypothetical protein
MINDFAGALPVTTRRFAGRQPHRIRLGKWRDCDLEAQYPATGASAFDCVAWSFRGDTLDQSDAR